MPASSTRNTVARQWELLKLLPTRGAGKSASELAAKLNEFGYVVSKRQVERDLQELRDVLPVDCNNKSVPYGWLLVPSAYDIPGMTLADALSLTLVEASLQTVLPRSLLEPLDLRFGQAKRKLSALAPTNSFAAWANKVRHVSPSLPLTPPDYDHEVLSTVQEALLRELQVEVSYLALGNAAPSTLRLHPLGLIQRGPVTYLVATTFDYPDVRLYAIHRIKAATMSNLAATQPNNFDLDAYIDSGGAQFGAGVRIVLNAWITEHLAVILRETPMGSDQVLSEAPEGGFFLTVSVADSWQLRWWILSQSAAIRVDAPIELRTEIIESLTRTTRLYSQ